MYLKTTVYYTNLLHYTVPAYRAHTRSALGSTHRTMKMTWRGGRYAYYKAGLAGQWPCFSRSLGHWPKDGPAALADGRSSNSRLFTL